MNYSAEALAQLAAEQARRNNEAVEQMVERMLVTPGEWGVLVHNLPDGTVRVELSDEVPPMTVNYRRD